MKPYYDHDFLWAQRELAGHPVWGSNSHRVYKGVLEVLATHAPHQIKIMLDVGCGAGAFGVLALAQGFQYFGVDASTVGIALGKQHHKTVQLAVADFATNNISAIGDQRFPIVCSVNVLHCLTGADERHTFLTNLTKASTDDAVLVLTTMIGPVDEDARETRLPRAYKLADEIVDELRQAGWREVIYKDVAERDGFSKIGNLTIACRKS